MIQTTSIPLRSGSNSHVAKSAPATTPATSTPAAAYWFARSARWTAYEAVWKLETGRADAGEAVSVAKAVASEGFYRVCEAAHHVHAGIGSDKAYGLYLYTKTSRSLYHYLGDPAFHRQRLVELLKL